MDGKKFKTREGDIVELDSLLLEAQKRAKEKIMQKEAEKTQEKRLSLDEIEHASQVIGYGAVKYADLKSNRVTNYTFSFDKMLDLKGNTAVYLLYAFARIQSIIRKAQQQVVAPQVAIKLEHTAEYHLGLRLVRFKEVVENVLETMEPHLLCDYLYDLATTFNQFHRDCRVVESTGQINMHRLQLCKATAQVMAKCFDLLGLETLDRI